VVIGKKFAIQDCTVTNTGVIKTVTFNSDGSITNSNGNTLPATQVAANFSTSGFTDSSGTSYATLYSYSYGPSIGTAYFLLSRVAESTKKFVQIGVVIP